MPRPKVESRPLAWPRVVVLALVGIAAAGCSDSARFDSSSYTTDRPPATERGRRDHRRYSAARPCRGSAPAGAEPARTVAAAPGAVRYTAGGVYRRRPAILMSPAQYADVDGGSASGHWTWNGGSPVTVGHGETVESIARKHGVPVFGAYADQRHSRAGPDQAGSASGHSALRVDRAEKRADMRRAAQAGGNVHVVKAGETLMSIARGTGVSVAALAKTNHIESSKKLSIGDRLTIPAGGHQVAAAHPARGSQGRAAAHCSG